MGSRETTGNHYQIVNGERIEISEKVYEFLCGEHSRNRSLARAECRCAQPNYRKCCGNCWSCPWYNNGPLESIEESLEKRGIAYASNENVEEKVLTHLTVQRLYLKADELVKDGAAILRLQYEENLSIREISRRLGISHVAVMKRIELLRTYFRKHKKYFL